MFSLPPETTAGSEVDATADLTGFEVEVPGLLRYMDVTDPGMHTTDTIDFEVVLEGTVVLELDDGAEVTLRPGDTVVQNGTRHRWRNPGDTTARLAVFMCGASHADVPAADA
jgi:mannose-6-phosphate isomerase-like protein (cupin superfamily)